MPEILSCPECERKVRVPDESLGKKVKCPGCGAAFLARAASKDDDDEPEEERRPARAASRSRRDEDEDEDERPRSRRSRDDDDEDEPEEDEDRPRSRRSRDEDEDEDDRPKKKKKKGRSGSSAYALPSLGMLLLVCATGVLVFIFLLAQGGYWLGMKLQSTTFISVVDWTIYLLAFVFIAAAAGGHGLSMMIPSKSGDSAKFLGIATFVAAAMAAFGLTMQLICFPNDMALGGSRSSVPSSIDLPMGLGPVFRPDFWGLFQFVCSASRHVGMNFTFVLGCLFLYSLSQRLDRSDIARHVVLFALAQFALLEAWEYIPRFIMQLLFMMTSRSNAASMGSVFEWTVWLFQLLRHVVQIAIAAYYVLILLQLKSAMARGERRD